MYKSWFCTFSPRCTKHCFVHWRSDVQFSVLYIDTQMYKSVFCTLPPRCTNYGFVHFHSDVQIMVLYIRPQMYQPRFCTLPKCTGCENPKIEIQKCKHYTWRITSTGRVLPIHQVSTQTNAGVDWSSFPENDMFQFFAIIFLPPWNGTLRSITVNRYPDKVTWTQSGAWNRNLKKVDKNFFKKLLAKNLLLG